MFCTKCGQQNIDGSTFCRSCGNPLQAPGGSQPQRPQSYNTQDQSQYNPPPPGVYNGYYTQAPKKTGKGLIIGIIAGGAVLIAAAIVLIVLLTGGVPVLGLWHNEERGEVIEFKESGVFNIYAGSGDLTGQYIYDKGKGEGVITVNDTDYNFTVSKNIIIVEDIDTFIRANRDFDIDEFINNPAATLPPETDESPTPDITTAPTPESSGEELSEQDLLDYFIEVAVTNSEDTSQYNGFVKRWETPVRVEVIGDVTQEDWDTLNNLLITLNQIAPRLDIAFLEGEGNEGDNLKISFVPTELMAGAAENYLSGDKGCYYIYWGNDLRINRGTIAIDTNITSQTERNSLIIEFVTRSLGILNSSLKYPDSVYYDEWLKLQSLSVIDENVVAMLYSSAVFAGQTEADARAAIASLF